MSKGAEPVWVDPSVVDIIHHEQIIEHGGTTGLRDSGMLESALQRPFQTWQYQDPPADLCELAAAYAHSLAKNHPFLDGNKRTAAIVCELFLNLNNRVFTVDEVAKYPHYLALAAGEESMEDFTTWLREVTEEV